MPAGQGKDPERYAAWDESGSPLGPPAEDEFEHELALAAALDRNLTSLSPSAGESSRMHARMAAMLAGLSGQGPAGPPPRAPGAGTPSGAPFLEAPFPGTPVPGASFADSPFGEARFPEADTERTMRMEPIRDVAPVTAQAAAPTVAETRVTPTEAPTEATADPDTDPGSSGGAGHAPGVARSRRARHVLPRGYRDRPDSAAGSRRPERPSGRRRITVVAAAALLVVMALTGGGMLASRDALPGDSLYGVKRAAESFGSVFAFGSDAKARRQLDLASARLAEIEQLAARGGEDPAVLASAIADFDAATTDGSKLVLDGAEGNGPAGMSDLNTWARQASTRWTALRSTLPDPADADQSIALLDRVVDRSATLKSRLNCSNVSDGADDLGPLPATGACLPRTDPSTAATEKGTSQSARAGATTDQSNSSQPQTATATPESGSATTTTDGDGGVLPKLGTDGLPLPNPVTGSSTGSSATATSSAPSQKGLLPPITLPPLLPGTSGITLGG